MTYEFKCSKCDKIIEIQAKITDNIEEPICECGEKMKRVWNVPEIRFVGSGFHCNDYKK